MSDLRRVTADELPGADRERLAQVRAAAAAGMVAAAGAGQVSDKREEANRET
jgi:hypothetical protein